MARRADQEDGDHGGDAKGGEARRRWLSLSLKEIAIGLIVTIVGGIALYLIIEAIDGTDEPPKVRIDTAASLVNPSGYDNPAEEYICLVNEGEDAVELTGWELTDAEGIVNVLPLSSLEPRATVRVHPGGGDERADTASDLYGSEGTTWNNGGDTVTLYDADGAEVDSESFAERDDGEVRGDC